jgi:hypothetical protein
MEGNASVSDEDMDFIKLFLFYEGSLTKMQSALSVGYLEVKRRLYQINEKLGNEVNKVNEETLKSMANTSGDSMVVARLKEKMRQCGGRSSMIMLRGDPIGIRLSPDGKGIIADSYRSLVMEWRIFDAIVDKANSLGGKMFKGDAMAQGGARIGSVDFPLDTIDAYISTRFYGSKIGETATRRSTYYCAVLSWADIVENHRSEGEGSFIKVLAPFGRNEGW